MFTFLVTNTVDTIPPVVDNCPYPLTANVPLGTQTHSVTWTEPMATDDSGGQIRMIRSHAPGTEFAVGVTTVTYRFLDAAGNGAECVFTITGMDCGCLL